MHRLLARVDRLTRRLEALEHPPLPDALALMDHLSDAHLLAFRQALRRGDEAQAAAILGVPDLRHLDYTRLNAKLAAHEATPRR